MKPNYDATTPEEFLARQWNERVALVREVEDQMVRLKMPIPGRFVVPIHEPAPRGAHPRSTKSAVRAAAAALGESWTRGDVIAWVNENALYGRHTAGAIAIAIQRLCAVGECVPVVNGGRGRPGLYRLKSSTCAAA